MATIKCTAFLEQEGAEVDIQLVVNWGLYLLWGAQYDLAERAKLKVWIRGINKGAAENGGSKFALEGVNVAKNAGCSKAPNILCAGYFIPTPKY